MAEVIDYANLTNLEWLVYNFSSQNNYSGELRKMGGTDTTDQKFPVTAFLIQGLAITIVCTLGLIGNVFSVVIFSRMRRKSSFTCFLLGLTSCDTVLAFTSILTWGLPTTLEYLRVLQPLMNAVYPYFVIYVYPVAMTAQTGSVYFTIVVTIERYFAVCHPLESRRSRTFRRGLYISAIVVLLSALYNFPRWLEYKFGGDERPFEQTDLRKNDFYTRYYYNHGYFIVQFGFPMIVLSTLNCIIYRQICRSNKDRQNLSPTQTTENSLALMLVVAVIVFLLCNILPLINNMMEINNGDVYRPYVYVANFLVCLNSSVNVLIYYAFAERFRRYFKAITKQICCCFFAEGIGSAVGWRGIYHIGDLKSPSGSPSGSQKKDSLATTMSYCSRKSMNGALPSNNYHHHQNDLSIIRVKIGRPSFISQMEQR